MVPSSTSITCMFLITLCFVLDFLVLFSSLLQLKLYFVVVGLVHRHEKGAYMFGRLDLCDFVLEHPTISRFHAGML